MLMQRTHVHLTKHQLTSLREIADRTGIKPAEQIRRAISEYLEREHVNKSQTANR